METLIEQMVSGLPSYGSMEELLIFLLFVFGGLYLFFQLVFYLGDHAGKKKTVEKKEKPQKTEKQKPVIVKEKKEKPEIIILEEEKPLVIQQDPFYRNDNDYTYIRDVGNVEKNYSYGENYLHEYYNEKLPSDTQHIIAHQTANKATDDRYEDEVQKLLTKYKSLPSSYRAYLIEKFLANK